MRDINKEETQVWFGKVFMCGNHFLCNFFHNHAWMCFLLINYQ
jgi:hypothetical protein